MGVVFMAPRMIRRLMFYIWSAWLCWSWRPLSRMWRHTQPRVSQHLCKLSLGSCICAPPSLGKFLHKWEFFVVLASTASRCGFQVSRGSSVAPRNIPVSTRGSGCSPRVNLTCSFEVDSENMIETVLVLLILNAHLFVQTSTLLIVSWIRLDAMEVQSDSFQTANDRHVVCWRRVLALLSWCYWCR